MKNSEKTAIIRGSSWSAKWIADNMKPQTVLDFGAGKWRNAYYLKMHHFPVFVHDTPEQYANSDWDGKLRDEETDASSRIPIQRHITSERRHYSTILCSFVLNVVSPYEQAVILRQLCALATEHATVVIEVRTEKDVRKAVTATPTGDGGYRMCTGTYQFGFNEKYLMNLLKPFFRDITLYKGSSLMAVCKL